MKYGDISVQLPRVRSNDLPEVKEGEEYSLEEPYNYLLIKLRFFYTICIFVLIYTAIVNFIAVYVSNISNFMHYLDNEITAQSIIPVVIFAIIITVKEPSSFKREVSI